MIALQYEDKAVAEKKKDYFPTTGEILQAANRCLDENRQFASERELTVALDALAKRKIVKEVSETHWDLTQTVWGAMN